MLSFIVMLIVGGLIGWLAGAILGKDIPGGIIGNIIAGLIVDFRKSGNTYFLNIKEWDNLVSHINKKSFNENDLTEYSNPILVEKRKLKVNYRYNIEKFLEEVKP